MGTTAGAVSDRGGRFVQVPTSVARGEAIRVVATNLVSYKDVGSTARDFRYRLTVDQLAADRRPGRPCVRNIDTSFPVGSAAAKPTWKGHFPSSLVCYDARSGRRLGTIAVRPGSAYRFVVGVKTGKGAWDSRGSVLVRKVVVKRG